MSQLLENLEKLSMEQIGIIICFIFIIFKKLTTKKRSCPHCKKDLKNQIIPKSIKSFFSGELVCNHCKKEVDVDFFGNIKR